MTCENLFSGIPPQLPEELVTVLCRNKGIRIERITRLVGELNTRLFARLWALMAPLILRMREKMPSLATASPPINPRDRRKAQVAGVEREERPSGAWSTRITL